MSEAPNGWEQKNLSELLHLLGGNAFKSNDSTDVGIRWLKIANVGFGKVEWDAIDYLPISFQDDYLKYVLSENDIVMALTRPILSGKLKIAKVGKEDAPALLNQRVAKLIPNKGFSLEYLYQLLTKRSTVAMIENAIAGTDPPNLGFNDLKKISLSVPVNTKEQIKIVSILSTWDRAIELKERLIEQKKEQKKGLMQKLLTSEVRLPGVAGNFNLYKLNQVLKVRHGKDQKKVEKESGHYPILGTGGQIGRTDQFLYNKESVLIGRKGTIDRPFYMDKPFWTVDTLFYTEIIEGFHPKYIYYLFNRIPWKKYNEASGVPSLSASTIGSIQVLMPNYQTQKEIAKILTKMDEEIGLLRKEAQLLKEQKKGLMQNLLTGKIRVKV